MTHPDRPGNWRVENGILIGRGPKVSYLFTERGDYQDFHFRVEARINDGGNSGMFFRKPSTSSVTDGYQAQIDSSRHKGKTGSLYVGKGTPEVVIPEVLVPVDKRFTQEVICRGDHIVIPVNSKKVVDYVDRAKTFTRGHLALEVFDPPTVVQLRRVEVKELTPGAAAADPERQVAEWVLQVGGLIHVAADGNLVEVRPGGVLPAKAFRVRRINFQGSAKVKDDDLKRLAALAELRWLDLQTTPITGAGLAHLRTLTTLEHLNLMNLKLKGPELVPVVALPALRHLALDGNPITDANLKYLAGATQLTGIEMGGLPITDAGLVHLRDLVNLESLDLVNTINVSGRGFIHLGKLQKLRWLDLRTSTHDDEALAAIGRLRALANVSWGNMEKVTDKGLAALTGVAARENISLRGSKVTDAGLKHPKAFPKLKAIDLSETQISDAGLAHLQGLATLQELRLEKTRVTAAGLEQLLKALPKCKIVAS
jgi:hypothetical protein